MDELGIHVAVQSDDAEQAVRSIARLACGYRAGLPPKLSSESVVGERTLLSPAYSTAIILPMSNTDGNCLGGGGRSTSISDC